MEYRIRPAARSDLASIVGLIRALADFEHLPGPDEEAVARLEKHGFGPSPYFEALVVEVNEAVVGFALFFMTYSTFLARPSLYLEDLFVLPNHRRQGIATALFRRLAAIAVERDCGRFEWTVLDWNQSAQDFYTALGANVLPDWRICRIDRQTILTRLANGISSRPE